MPLRNCWIGTLVSVFLTITFCVDRASAWNGTGHMVVAKIAYDNLSEPVKEKLQKILKAHPSYARDFQVMVPEGIDADVVAFMKAATWPDLIRTPRHPLHKESQPSWHFIDYPINLDGQKGPVPEEEGGKPDNILKALKQNVSDLTDATDAIVRAKALCWVLHLSGDIHQPLHCASLFSEQFPDRDGDRGGNRFLVRSTSGTIPLHTLWDHLLGNAESPKILYFFAKSIQTSSNTKRDALAEELKKMSFKEWAQESFEEARDLVYDEGRLQGARAPDERDSPPPAVVPALPVGYERSATDIARRRMALAGYRLAAKLNALFE